MIPLAAMVPPNLLRTGDDLADCMDALSRSGRVALDTEFLRERTYTPELCLIQIAGDSPADADPKTGHAVCIDPLAIDDLSPLSALLADSGVHKIFHSCRQDLEALDTRMAVRAGNLYDTQLAAAFCGYGDQASYAALVESVCAVHLPKSHTRTDWSRRPLSRAQLEYALDDVRYLPALRRELDCMLEQKGRIPWHRAECEAAADPAHYRFDPDNAWTRLRGIERLDAAGRACAQRLAAWRERRAQDRNLPRGWILTTPALLQICRERPATTEALTKIPGITPKMAKRAGREILAMMARGDSNGEDAGLEAARAPARLLTAEQRRTVKHIMGLLEQRAQQAEISRSLFANRQEVESFVRGRTDLPLFAGWRAQLAGDEILARYS